MEAEPDSLENYGVIEPVSYSEWAVPIVPVVKQDGSIRICGDFRVTINQVAERDMYPLPKVDDLLATLAGGKTFSKLDLSHAYQQIRLSSSSSEYQYQQGFVSVYLTALWDLSCAIYLPANHGKPPQRNPSSGRIH